jgi:hypothetical protein
VAAQARLGLLQGYLLFAGRTLDTSWALKFKEAKADADLNAAAVRSIHEKADPSQASKASIGT